MIAMAKIFKSGSSQIVRLPRQFHFDADEVCIKRVGSAILLFPKDAAWDLMAQSIGKFDDDFMIERNQPQMAETRKPLDVKKGKPR